MNRRLVTCMCALIALTLTVSAQVPSARATGDQRRQYVFAPTGQAYLKTGTLSDTRALAGYVRAKSGRVYAVSMIVTDPAAAKGTPALDSLVEWVVRAG